MALFWELSQSRRISKAEADATAARTDARRQAERVRAELAARCDKALLVCEAMWTLLRDKLGVTEKELLERVREVDLSDGRLDGRIARPPIQCPACQREATQRHYRCIYCGEPLEGDAFDR